MLCYSISNVLVEHNFFASKGTWPHNVDHMIVNTYALRGKFYFTYVGDNGPVMIQGLELVCASLRSTSQKIVKQKG